MSRTTGIYTTQTTHITLFTKLKKNLPQFAYHEATYFLVRLLQEFTGFTLDKSLNIQPPAEWASTCDGLKGTDKVHPGAHLTMFVRVRFFYFLFGDENLCNRPF